MTDWVGANRAHWMERTEVHLAPGGWDRAGFVTGQAGGIEALLVEEVGDVTGLELLHLQCHFGADSISWARLGARVTGVDFDPTAIAAARDLAADCGVEVSFVEADVREVDLGHLFDVVFVSHGALCWLPDLRPWAATVARHLRPGGFLYVFEFHPFGMSLADDATMSDLRMAYPYLHAPKDPMVFADEPGDYFNPEATIHAPQYVWNHGLGEVVSAVAGVGLTVEFLHEWPFCGAPIAPVMEARDDGWTRLPGTDAYPLGYSLRARRRPGT